MVSNMLQVKYERAGSRSNKLLRPIGISLPEAKDNSLLLGRRPSGTGSNLLEAGDATSASLLPAQISGSKTVKNPLEDEQSTVAQAKGKPSRASTEREEPTPPSPDAFGVFRRFRRNDASTEGNLSTSSAGFAESIVDPSVAAMLTSRLDVLSGELLNCIGAVDDEVRLQERGVKAANAVLCSTEPVIAGLEKYLEKESALLDELKNVARSVQQMYVLAEMTEAVEAAETCLGRLEELLAHVLDLALELKRFVAAADIRYGYRSAGKLMDVVDACVHCFILRRHVWNVVTRCFAQTKPPKSESSVVRPRPAPFISNKLPSSSPSLRKPLAA